MTTLGIDYATKPDLRAAWDAGYRFLIRYIAPPDAKYDWKRITPAERDEAWSIGFSLLLVFESWAGRALDGFQAGVDDARVGVDAARALGYPDDVPLFFADDTDSTADQVRPYFKGVATIRPCSGAYGGRKVTAPLLADGTVRFAFQACAWSMPPTVRQGSSGPAVRELQQLLGITQDGVFGPGTATAVRAFQNANGLGVDGIVGPMTWDRLGGAIDPSSHIYQRYSPTTTLAGSFDEDMLLRPVPMWTPPGTAPVPAPAASPLPVASPVSRPVPDSVSTAIEDDAMFIYAAIDGPAPGAEFYTFGTGKLIHIDGPTSQGLTSGPDPVVVKRVSWAQLQAAGAVL